MQNVDDSRFYPWCETKSGVWGDYEILVAKQILFQAGLYEGKITFRTSTAIHL